MMNLVAFSVARLITIVLFCYENLMIFSTLSGEKQVVVMLITYLDLELRLRMPSSDIVSKWCK
jgi:hypothetical protein